MLLRDDAREGSARWSLSAMQFPRRQKQCHARSSIRPRFSSSVNAIGDGDRDLSDTGRIERERQIAQTNEMQLFSRGKFLKEQVNCGAVEKWVGKASKAKRHSNLILLR